MRNEMIQSALGEGADAQSVATATVRALTLLFDAVKPLVGNLALRALYVRSLHLARSSLERPTPAPSETESPDELLASLKRDLLSRSPAAARGAAKGY